MDKNIERRLAYLKKQIEAENISYEERAELQSLVNHVDRGDGLLCQWAGVPEMIKGGELWEISLMESMRNVQDVGGH
jgi:hypothetical protein